MKWLKGAVLATAGLSIVQLAVIDLMRAQEEVPAAPRECTFTQNPDEFLTAQTRVRGDVYERTRKFAAGRTASAASTTLAASDVPRRNLIDDEIFGKLAQMNVRSAALTTDEEFLRRIYLDLTGRVPSREQIENFRNDGSDSKRDIVIYQLLNSPEFVDRWTMWVGDWLGNTAILSTAANQRMINGRNAFHAYIRSSIESAKPIRDLAWESVAASGSTYDHDAGAVNFAAGASAAMGPVQDTYDMMLFRTASTFLGLAHYDCLACHNGRGHLDQISLWARNTTRMDAWKMSAFFARMRFTRDRAGQYTNPRFGNVDIFDAPAGSYVLNTVSGNRPARCANALPVNEQGRCVSTQNLEPEYRLDGKKPKSTAWRDSFADYMVDDPMFARNFVNRIWKQMFSLGLVDPVDSMDPARLDPKNPPPAPWTLQATHPELLERLSAYFIETNYSLRELLRFIASSSAYQLSSRYEGDWKIEYVPLFARHYPRRLEGEEVHDIITTSTGVMARYTWSLADGQTIPRGTPQPQSEPVTFAMQLPEPVEPRNNGAAANFMNVFLRGNRDTALRQQAGSILQQLNLMNDRFVTTRVKVAASPVLRDLARMTDNNELVEELFLNFLSRRPSDRERSAALRHLERTPNRNTAVEDLAWTAINKVDFIFSY